MRRQKNALHSPLKKLLFWCILLIISAILVVGVELGLRFTGYGQSLEVFKPVEDFPGYLRINPVLGKRYFPASGTRPGVAHNNFLRQNKASGSIRIFVLGGSTAAGYPYHYRQGFPSILAQMMNEKYPKETIEIINLAMPAVSSYTVRDIGIRSLNYDPDIILIYTGHNEFYGGLGVGSSESLGNSRTLINLYLSLADYRVFQLVQDVVSGIQSIFASDNSEGKGQHSTLMARMAQNQHIPINSPLIGEAASNFKNNMADLINAARDTNTPVILGTVSSNLRDHAPFQDVFAEHTERDAWQAALNEVLIQFEASNYAAAQENAAALSQLDSLPASPYFWLGKAYGAMGDSISAHNALLRAKERDGLRFRAPLIINQAIQDLASESLAIVAPVSEAFDANSPQGITDSTLFLEHLHPNIDGYKLMAGVYLDAIESAGLIQRHSTSSGAKYGTIKSATPSNKPQYLTPVENEYADLRVSYLMSGWPFKKTMPEAMHAFKPADDDVVKLLAYRYWQNEISWEEMMVSAARHYEETARIEEAVRVYRAIAQLLPAHSSPYLQVARLHIAQDKPMLAIKMLVQALRHTSDAEVYFTLGSVLLAEGGDKQALVYLRRGIQLAPEHAGLRFRFAEGSLRTGSIAEAAATVRFLSNSMSDRPEFKRLQEAVEKRMASRN